MRLLYRCSCYFINGCVCVYVCICRGLVSRKSEWCHTMLSLRRVKVRQDRQTPKAVKTCTKATSVWWRQDASYTLFLLNNKTLHPDDQDEEEGSEEAEQGEGKRKKPLHIIIISSSTHKHTVVRISRWQPPAFTACPALQLRSKAWCDVCVMWSCSTSCVCQR